MYKSVSVNPYAKKSIFLVVLFVIVRLVVSGFMGLGNDESYYWAYGKQLQWNYFDHPPLVALWVKIFTLNLALEDYTWGIRLGSFAGGALASGFIYKTITAIGTPKAAFTGVLLYNTSFYASITAGLMLTPDAPQMVFWTASMYLITKLAANENSWRYWIAFGICTGLCIMSKLHGVFLWGGMGLYILFYKRAWLLKGPLYVSFLITLLIISPIFIWNWQHDFITYRFHSERVVIWDYKIRWGGFVKEITGQLVVNNLVNVLLILYFLLFARLRGNGRKPLQLFNCVALSLLAIILLIALFRQTLPHWSGPVYITLLPMAAIGLADVNVKAYKRVVGYLAVYTALFLGLMAGLTNYYPGTFGDKNPVELGKGDISLDSYGWKKAGDVFVELYNQQTAHLPQGKKPPLVCSTWWGAQAEYFFAKPLGINMIGLGPVNDIHHYHWRNRVSLAGQPMDTAFCVVPSDGYYDVKTAFASYYRFADSVTAIQIKRGGLPAHYFYVYKLYGWKNAVSGD